jgi:FAD:protein FMN transferase
MLRWLPWLCLSVAALANLFQSPVASAFRRKEASELHRYEAVEPHMGTLVRVTVYTPDEQTAKAAFRAAFDRIRDLDEILSDYKPDSELNRITKTAGHRAVPVSEDLFTVLRASQELAAATDGAFDITQAPVIQLWREARRTGRMPDGAALRVAAKRAGFRKLHLDAERRTVRFDMAGMALDVGGIGKGYAASEAIEALDVLGVRSALVAVSGDLAFSDAPPGQRGWRIGVHSDDPSVVGVPGVLELTNGAVSTAGNSQQHVDINGRRYSHIIDSSSGMGLVDDITVTVVAPNGLEADGLDTAASVLGAERGLALIESHPNAAALIIEHMTAGPRVRQSSGFVRLLSRRRD